MRSDHPREKLLASLAGAVALLIATSATLRPALLYAQEESFVVAPSAGDGDTAPTWEPVADSAEVAHSAEIADSAEDTADGQVLELPQVVAVDQRDSAAVPADSSNADSTLSADQPGDVADYNAQEAVGAALPGARLAPAAPLETTTPRAPTTVIGANWVAAGWPGYIVARPLAFAPIPATSPMLTTPRGSHVIMGGWWRAH